MLTFSQADGFEALGLDELVGQETGQARPAGRPEGETSHGREAPLRVHVLHAVIPSRGF